MKQSTIIDIAKQLSISPSTVSRALSDHPDIKLATKELVKKVALELQYSPNPIARSLKNNRSSTIGVLVPEIKHDFFSSAISGIEEVSYEAGYTIIVCQSNESYEREVINTTVLMQHRVAGVIASISQNTKSDDHFQDLVARKIPLVFFDRICNGVHASKVIIDDYQSAFDAVTYLIGKGYKKIAHLGGPEQLGICAARRQGYLDAVHRYGVHANEGFATYGGLHEQDGYDAMCILLAGETLPDAIFAVNDPVAIGAFQKIKEAGLAVPGDVAIMGFSNNIITALVDPPITTIAQPSFEMGRKAAAVLIAAVEDKTTEPVTIVLPTTLIERRST
jgi:DNA-binding LacI/PurR family transcriptional regulator